MVAYEMVAYATIVNEMIAYTSIVNEMVAYTTIAFAICSLASNIS